METAARRMAKWRVRGGMLELGARTLVMGIVNVTPDSFSDGGLYLDSEAAVRHALELLREGADLLDLGAESTRPGSHAGGADAEVSSDEELARLLPVIEEIKTERPDAVLSVDTYKAATARAALSAGAAIVNDVSGFTWDAAMAQVCAEARCGVVLMHARGRPEEWRTLPALTADAMMADVRAGLKKSLDVAERAGIGLDAVVLDPGYGFGKRGAANYALLARQDELLALGRPLAVGLSRKSFLGQTLTAINDGSAPAAQERETASLAAMTAAILHGASVVRVHAVRAAVEAARIADEVANRQGSESAS